jgi:hypothetical protein
MQHRSERVRLETERYRIFGTLTLPRDGYRSRMSDYLNAADREFVSLTEVVMEEIEGGAISRHEYVAVSRRHIVFAAPVAEEAVTGPNRAGA